MRALIGEDILTVWEQIHALPQEQVVVTMLALAWPERSAADWATLPLGERNALLLEMRAMMLGSRMEGFAACPACGAQLEFAFDARQLARELQTQPAPQPHQTGGCALRPVNTWDLLAAAAVGDEERAGAILLARTAGVETGAMEEASPDAAARAAQQWLRSQSEEVAASLTKEFDRINTAAEIRVQLDCAVCHERPLLDLDVARFVLREISRAARRLMAEIHELSSAYGWSESSIAAMSPVRRAAYLEMVGA